MSDWLPVIGTLSGAIVAGAISVLVHQISNRHAIRNTKLVLSEERAKWAIEIRLERLQIFYAEVEKLLVATTQFRVQQAWQASLKRLESDRTPPNWVISYDDARGGWEDQWDSITRELLLQEEEVQAEFEQSDIDWFRWLRSESDDDGVQALVQMEGDIRKFRRWLAERYRFHFKERLMGKDIGL